LRRACKRSPLNYSKNGVQNQPWQRYRCMRLREACPPALWRHHLSLGGMDTGLKGAPQQAQKKVLQESHPLLGNHDGATTGLTRGATDFMRLDSRWWCHPMQPMVGRTRPLSPQAPTWLPGQPAAAMPLGWRRAPDIARCVALLTLRVRPEGGLSWWVFPGSFKNDLKLKAKK
jgi:hypothetical protein